MKKHAGNILLIVLVCGIQSLPAQNHTWLKSPESTFKKLIRAIRKEDILTYKSCWHPDQVEREGMITELVESPETWTELQGIFKGRQKFQEGKYYSRDGREFFKTTIKAPKAEQGGIGTITFVREGENWLLWRW